MSLPLFGHQFGRDVREGRDYEAALPHARVGHDEVVLLDRKVAYQQDVDIEGPRPPPLGSDTPGCTLEPTAQSEEVTRRRSGVDLHDDIEVALLVRRATDGLGLVDRRDRDDAVERRDCVSQVAAAVAKVRPETEEGSQLELPANPDARVIHLDGHRRTQLANGHGDSRRTSVCERDLGDAFRQAFEQVEVVAFDDGDDSLRNRPVVDRVRKVVARSSRSEVGLDLEVDLERLRSLVFFGQHPVAAEGADTAQLYAVPHSPSTISVTGQSDSGTTAAKINRTAARR